MASTPDQSNLNVLQDVPPPALTIHLFGNFEVGIGAAPMGRVRTRSVEWVLALLALRAAETHRSWLAGTLWPESSETSALLNLRCNLLHLRRALGPVSSHLLTPTPRTLCLDRSAAWVDVHEFDACIARGDEGSLQRAVSLYRGPLLRGCFEPWAQQERVSREEACLAALENLARAAYARGERQTALAYLLRAEALDPLRESVQQELMRQIAAAGEVASAVRRFTEFRSRLHRELNLQPGPESEQLFRKLLRSARTAQRTEPRSDPSVWTAAPDSCLGELDASGWEAGRSLPEPPEPLTRLLGREAEIKTITSAISQERLVTLCGIGGVGKTRLAIAAAQVWKSEGRGRLAYVGLAPFAAPETLAGELAQALGDAAGATPRDRIRNILGKEPALLVLDNCEHLLPHCAQLTAEILGGCSALRVLATSRQALGISGERVLQVMPLAQPEPGRPEAVAVAASPAAALFLERAAAARPGFALQPADTPHLVEICRRLDGVPLALELAAFRSRVMGLREIASGLVDPLKLLNRGDSTTHARHQSLRALIGSSYEQLDNPERRLLESLSILPAPWSLEAAGAAVGALDPGEPELPDLVDSLVSRSLLATNAEGDSIRFSMLEIVREYARERLRESGREPEVWLRVAEEYTAQAERIEPDLWGPAAEGAVSRIDSDRTALHAVVKWSSRHAPRLYARLSGSLARYWEARGDLAEGSGHLEAALQHAALSDSERARALLGAANLARSRHRRAEEAVYAEQAAQLYVGLADEVGLGRALLTQGICAQSERDADHAWELLMQAAERLLRVEPGSAVRALIIMIYTARIGDAACKPERLSEIDRLTAVAESSLRDPIGRANCLEVFGMAANEAGRREEARSWTQQALRLLEARGATARVQYLRDVLAEIAEQDADWATALFHYRAALELARLRPNEEAAGWPLINVANSLLRAGRLDEAQPVYQEALELFLKLGNRYGAACAFHNLGTLSFRRGDYEYSRRLHERSLAAYQEVESEEGLIVAMERLGIVEAFSGAASRAAQLLAAADRLRANARMARHPSDDQDYSAAMARVHEALEPAALEFALEAGRALTVDRALRCALGG